MFLDKKTHFTKLCHKTPVGSSKTLTYTVMSADSSSIVGRMWPSCTLKSLRNSLKRVKPQSLSSAMKRWLASVRDIASLQEGIEKTVRTANSVDSWIVRIGNNQSKLGTRVPSFRRLLRLCIIQIYRYSIIWGCVRVSKREEENSPEALPNSVNKSNAETGKETDHLWPPHSNSGLVNFFSSFFQLFKRQVKTWKSLMSWPRSGICFAAKASSSGWMIVSMLGVAVETWMLTIPYWYYFVYFHWRGTILLLI